MEGCTRTPTAPRGFSTRKRTRDVTKEPKVLTKRLLTNKQWIVDSVRTSLFFSSIFSFLLVLDVFAFWILGFGIFDVFDIFGIF